MAGHPQVHRMAACLNEQLSPEVIQRCTVLRGVWLQRVPAGQQQQDKTPTGWQACILKAAQGPLVAAGACSRMGAWSSNVTRATGTSLELLHCCGCLAAASACRTARAGQDIGWQDE
jgi:hypothetical protein